MLSNPDELYRMLGLINDPSSLTHDGKSFTDNQVELQLNTTTRKLETIKADLEDLIYSIGTGGGFSFLKEMLEQIDRLIVGVNEFGKSFGTVIVSIAGVATAFKTFAIVSKWIDKIGYSFALLKNATRSDTVETERATMAHAHLYSSLTLEEKAKVAAKLASMGYTSQQIAEIARIDADTASIEANTVAQTENNAVKRQGALSNVGNAVQGASKKVGTFGAVVGALGGPVGIFITALVALLPFLVEYIDSLGTAKKKTDELKNSVDEHIASVENEVESLSRKEGYLKQISEQYNKMQDAIDSGTLSEKEATKTKERMESIQRALSQTLHASSDQFVEDNKINIKSVEELMKVQKEEAIKKIEAEEQKLDAQIESTSTALQEQEKLISGHIEEQKVVAESIKAYNELARARAEDKKRRAEEGLAYLNEKKNAKKFTDENLPEFANKNLQGFAKNQSFGIMGSNLGMEAYTAKGEEGLKQDAKDAEERLEEIEKWNGNAFDMDTSYNAQAKIQELQKEADELRVKKAEITLRKEHLLNGNPYDDNQRGIHQEDPEKAEKAAQKAARAAEKARKEELKRVKASVENPKTTYESIKKQNEETSALRDLTEDEKKKEKEAKKAYNQALIKGINTLSERNGFENILEKPDEAKFSWTNDPTLDKYIVDASKEFGIPAKMIASMAKIESSFDQDSISSAGAIGLMQLVPSTASYLGVNPYDAHDNIRGGAKYMSELYQKYGNWDLVAAAYNAGENAVDSYGGIPPYQETENHVRKFNNALQQYDEAISNFADGYKLKDNYHLNLPDLDNDDVKVDESKLEAEFAKLYETETTSFIKDTIAEIKKTLDSTNEAISNTYKKHRSDLGNSLTEVDDKKLSEMQIQDEIAALQKAIEAMKNEGLETYKYFKELSTLYSEKIAQLSKIEIEKINAYYSEISKIREYNKNIEKSKVMKAPTTNKSIFSMSPFNPDNQPISYHSKDKTTEYRQEERNLQMLIDQYKELSANSQADVSVLMDVNQKIAESYSKLAELSNDYHQSLINNLEQISEEIFLSDSGNIIENTRNVVDKLWKGLASDTMKALWGVKNDNPSMLGQMLGLGSPDITEQQITALDNNRLEIVRNTEALNKLISVEQDRAYLSRYGKADYDNLVKARTLASYDYAEDMARSEMSSGKTGLYYKPNYRDIYVDNYGKIKTAAQERARDKFMADYDIASYDEFKETGSFKHNAFWRRNSVDARPSVLKQDVSQQLANADRTVNSYGNLTKTYVSKQYTADDFIEKIREEKMKGDYGLKVEALKGFDEAVKAGRYSPGTHEHTDQYIADLRASVESIDQSIKQEAQKMADEANQKASATAYQTNNQVDDVPRPYAASLPTDDGTYATSPLNREIGSLSQSSQTAANSLSEVSTALKNTTTISQKNIDVEEKGVDVKKSSTNAVMGISAGLMLLNTTGNKTLSTIANVISILLPVASNFHWFGLKDGGKLATGGAFKTGGLLHNLSAFASGGHMKAQDSGQINGAGTGRSDSILAYLANKDKFVWLSNGEYVINEKSAKALGKDTLDSLNAYADGGSLAPQMVNPTPYVPSINPRVVQRYSNARDGGSLAMQKLLMEQNKKMDEQSRIMSGLGSDGQGGNVVVLNTHASSDDVMRALQENPRALNSILGRQNRMGFR